MTDPLLDQIQRTIEAASKTVSEQHRRIARQRARVEELEQNGNREVAKEAKRVLELMEEFLDRQKRELADAEHRRVARLQTLR
jgi:uncharacterized coiled-coil protein SlyX